MGGKGLRPGLIDKGAGRGQQRTGLVCRGLEVEPASGMAKLTQWSLTRYHLQNTWPAQSEKTLEPLTFRSVDM